MCVGVSGHRALREVGRGGAGEDESKRWSGESRRSDVTLDAGTEEDEVDHAPLTASPWGMQESGARGLQGDARDGGSDSGKGTCRPTGGRHGSAMGRGV